MFETFAKPLLFGAAINLFTLSLFPDVTLQSRIAYWKYAPVTNLVQHWLWGNIFLVQFMHCMVDLHLFLRQGALWHIRKYLDPSGQSIRDMINKDLSWHILKH